MSKEKERVLKILGKGSFGSVALISVQNKLYALKILKYTDTQTQSRIIKEIEIMQYLERICRDYFVCYSGYDLTHQKYAKIYMEYIPQSITLNKFLDGKQPKSITILYLMKQLLHGLKLLHKQKVVHRDIKPSNIIYVKDRGSHCKYIDLGTACLDYEYYNSSVNSGRIIPPIDGYTSKDEIKISNAEVITRENSYKKDILNIIGTPYFMSPELIRGDIKYFDELYASDIWALGITFYLLAFGEYPEKFKETRPKQLFFIGTLSNPLKIPSRVTGLWQQFQYIIDVMCNIDPTRRDLDSVEYFLDMFINEFLAQSNKTTIKAKDTEHFIRKKYNNNLLKTIEITSIPKLKKQLKPSSLKKWNTLQDLYRQKRKEIKTSKSYG